MKRFFLFGLLFLVFLLLTAPLERYVRPYLDSALARSGLQLKMKTLRLSLPAGLKVSELRVDSDGFSLDLDSLYVGFLRSFEARGCRGARIGGKVTGDSVFVEVSDLDPSRCMRIGRLNLEGSFDGVFTMTGVSLLRGTVDDKAKVHVELHTKGGTFGGFVPRSAESRNADVPIGEWEFQDVNLDADYRDERLDVHEGTAMTNGVAWELLGASTRPGVDEAREIRIDFRARIEEDSPRAKALLGLMPKSSEDADGWHHYRVVGTTGAMKVIGLE